MSKSSRPVYSTSSGRLCPQCSKPVADCTCSSNSLPKNDPAGSNVYLARERKGRGGKVVTLIKQLPLNQADLKLLASELKNKCGTGGTVSQGIIEIQGDQRLVLQRLLEAKGYTVKLSGG